jgi:hydrogenase maturation factor
LEEAVGSPLLNQVNELGREEEWRALPSDPKLGLEVAKDVAKVDVEELSVLLHH